MIRKHSSLCTIYTGFWVLYHLQGILYTSSSKISLLCLVAILVFGLYHVVLVNLAQYKPPIIKGFNLLLILTITYGLLQILFEKHFVITLGVRFIEVPSSYFLKVNLISFLPFYVYYYHVLKGNIDVNWLKRCIIVLTILATIDYFKNYNEMLLAAINGQEEFTNNIGYSFLSILPALVFFRSKKWLQFGLLCYCSYFIFSSMKRGCILIAIPCILVLLFETMKAASKKTRIIAILFSILFIISCVYIVNYYLETSDYFIQRIQQTLEGGSQSREYIKEKLWNHIYINMNDFSFLFGEGACATVDISGNFAHQDWLELFIDCGIFGIVVYLYFYFSFMKYIRTIQNRALFIVMFMCVFSLFLRSLFSMGYESIGVTQGLLIGYCIAMNQKRLFNKETNNIDEILVF